MNTSRAVLAGVLGGVVMSILMALGRAVLGMETNLEMLMGTTLLGEGAAAWLLGLGMHLALSGLVALAYTWGFEALTRRASAALGAAFGVLHIAVAGVAMGAVVPLVHRWVPEQTPGPGYFLTNHGALGAAAFVVLHLVFGAVVGALYAGHVRAAAAA